MGKDRPFGLEDHQTWRVNVKYVTYMAVLVNTTARVYAVTPEVLRMYRFEIDTCCIKQDMHVDVYTNERNCIVKYDSISHTVALTYSIMS